MADFRKRFIYGTLVVSSFGLIAIGHFIPCWPFLAHILNETGIAGLIGFVLAMTIERLSQDELRRVVEEEKAAIKTNVFHYVYGRKIPREITHEIDTQILETDFVERWSLDFILTIIPDPETKKLYVLSECRTSFEVKNISGEEKAFPLRHFIDKSPIPSLANQVKYLELEVRVPRFPSSSM